jgi:hypothetical protein
VLLTIFWWMYGFTYERNERLKTPGFYAMQRIFPRKGRNLQVFGCLYSKLAWSQLERLKIGNAARYFSQSVRFPATAEIKPTALGSHQPQPSGGTMQGDSDWEPTVGYNAGGTGTPTKLWAARYKDPEAWLLIRCPQYPLCSKCASEKVPYGYGL